MPAAGYAKDWVDDRIVNYWANESTACPVGSESKVALDRSDILWICLLAISYVMLMSIGIFVGGWVTFATNIVSSVVWALEILSVFLTLFVTRWTYREIGKIFVEEVQGLLSLKEWQTLNEQKQRDSIEKIRRGIIKWFVFFVANFIPLVCAILFLILFQISADTPDIESSALWYVAYLMSLIIGFLLFAIMDFACALKSRALIETRICWMMLVFADVPAAVGATVVFSYFCFVLVDLGAKEALDITTTTGGTTIFQLAYASLIIGGIMTNRINSGFKMREKQLHYARMPDAP
jgi:hypothetical protein